MANRCVVRNAKYRRGGLNTRERHNERKNMDYQNGDINPARSPYNVHYKQCEGSYAATFDHMVADGEISTRGLGKDPHIVDELVFDVNSAYFENGGGYDFAKSFFEEAYRCAVGLIGGEQYVLSAVMHADERNKALSEQAGHDVYHYHLHVVYIPVVEKKVYFRKNNKDPELAGKLKEVITQVSHSKKWPKATQTDENGEVIRNSKGKAILVNSYSLMQDRFFQHMRDAGFNDFERGQRGSTAEHLSVLEYKTMKESERLADKCVELAAANKQISAANNQLANLGKEIKTTQGKVLSSKQIEKIPVKISRPMFGDADTASMPKSDWDNVKKTALTQSRKDEEYRAVQAENAALKKEKSAWNKEKRGLSDKVAELERSTKKDFLARASRDAELYNLKNAVAKIPADVWAMYTKSKAQQRNMEVR